jgi:fluoride ion exporter CrcB/FEX
MGMVFAVGVGGGLGALARYYIAGAIHSAATVFPWGIFVVNISGGLLMGLIVEASALKLNLPPICGLSSLSASSAATPLSPPSRWTAPCCCRRAPIPRPRRI